MNRGYAIVVSLLICGAVISPITQGFSERPVDDFPLSWYPMFSKPRPEFETPVYVIALDADGTRHKVDQNYWTSGGFNQGAFQMLRAADKGKSALEPLCGRIAKNVAKSRSRALSATAEVRIVRGRYELHQFFGEGNHEPIRENKLTSCPIVRAKK